MLFDPVKSRRITVIPIEVEALTTPVSPDTYKDETILKLVIDWLARMLAWGKQEA